MNSFNEENVLPYCVKCGNELSADEKFCPKCGTPVTGQPTATSPPEIAAPAAPNLKLAFWGERFVAWLIDVVIIGIVVAFLGLFTFFASGSFTWWSNWPNWVPFFNFNLGGVLYFVYWFLMDGLYGKSLGKMIMRLRIVQLNGGRINMGQSAIESVGKAFLLPIDVIVGWILYSRSRQRLFSNLSRTIVIRESGK